MALYKLKSYASFSETEKNLIDEIDDGYDLALSGTWGTMEEVKEKVFTFLKSYEEYKLEKSMTGGSYKTGD